jgi:hypothetical protein
VSTPAERAALRNRIRLDSEESKQLRKAISKERESLVDDAATDAVRAMTLAKPTLSPSAPMIADVFRAYLEDPEKRDLDGRTRLIQIIAKLVEVATSDSPKNIAAAELLIERGYGKAKPSDEALNALAKGGVQIVYIEAPDVAIGTQRKALPAKPEFVDCEILKED